MPTSLVFLARRGVFVLALGVIARGARGASSPTSREGAPPPAPTVAAPAAQSAPVGAVGFDFGANREDVFKAFYQTALDTSTAYSVTNLAIKKDSMTLLLKQGTVFLMQPIGGEVTGAAFIGDGEASMTPPSRTQRFMLNKYSGAETLKEPFTEAVFRFCDGTDRTIRALGQPAPASGEAARASQILGDRDGWLDGTRSQHLEIHLEMQFLENRISGLKGQDFFLADFHTAKHDRLTYLYNPHDIHENIISASATLGAKGRRYLVPWASWHKH